MTECKDCIHFEVCAYASHQLPICDSYAEKERHGRWGVDGVYVVCSVCDRPTLSPIVKQLPTFKYCPNCGAKMDGE